jgi:tetrahydromethanopterin S-methyltransferase subunit B
VKYDPLPIDLPDVADDYSADTGVNLFHGLLNGLVIVGLFAVVFVAFAVVTG